MTDRIDIDDLDVGEESEEETPNRGDWFWAGEGDPGEETGWLSDGEGSADDDSADAADEATDAQPTTPRVPRTDDDAPVGIPVHSGGAGAGEMRDDAESTTADGDPENGHAPTTDGESTVDHRPTAGGISHQSHADPDEMTTAFTYDAIRRLANPRRAIAEARGWSDWVGVVGDVDAHVLNTFQREHQLDLDFFNGTGTGPAERLASVDGHSMFYATRMVVVGTDGDRWIAEEADWEFVPLDEAAEGADWELDGT